MIFACSGHDQVGQGRPDTVVTPKGRAAQGRAGQGRTWYASAHPKPCQKHDRGSEMQTDCAKNMHMCQQAHTPLSPSTAEGDSTKRLEWGEKRIEQDKEDQDWQLIHVCVTCNRIIKGNAATSPAPNRRAAKGPSQHTPGQMPLALGLRIIAWSHQGCERPAGTWHKCLPLFRRDTSSTLAALHALASAQPDLT